MRATIAKELRSVATEERVHPRLVKRLWKETPSVRRHTLRVILRDEIARVPHIMSVRGDAKRSAKSQEYMTEIANKKERFRQAELAEMRQKHDRPAKKLPPRSRLKEVYNYARSFFTRHR